MIPNSQKHRKLSKIENAWSRWRIEANSLLNWLRALGVEPAAFADDFAIVLAADEEPQMKESIGKTILLIVRRSVRSDAKLNLKKTALLSFGKIGYNENVTHCGIEIKFGKKAKFLGVVITSSLK